jgi:uncharacterized protein DUF4331
MSSHREAPEISKDPAADNADVYAFVSPDKPSTVTLISNFVPLQDPPGGPNFFEFGDDVLYSIYIDNNGDGKPEISYVFRFTSHVRNPNTFLYNTGPITSLNSPNWNRRQFFTVTRVEGHDTTLYGTAATNGGTKHHPAPKLKTRVLGRNLASPPCNIGPRSTPNYAALGQAAVHSLPGGVSVFAGQRQDGFYVDLGSTFDLADLRPFQNLHLISTPAAAGVDATATLNIHTIAIQVPISQLTRDGSVPTSVSSSSAVLGVWSAASRRKVRMIDKANDEKSESGPWVQVSRLGNPLINEVVIPLGKKDKWNTLYPVGDKAFVSHYEHPELAGLLPVLYPGVFPNLKGLSAARADLVAALLTGIPPGIVPGFQNYTGKVMADQLRLNVAIPPTTSNPSIFGLLGGDAAGFPNGRRVFDDVVSIELRAIAGVTFALVDKSFTPDGAAGKLTEGLTPAANRYQATFPYLGPPLDGFDTPSSPTST